MSDASPMNLSSPAPPPRKPFWTRKRSWLLALGLLLLMLLGMWFAYLYSLSRRVEREYAALKAQGYPVTAEELNAWYPTPQGANAADVYAKVQAALAQQPIEPPRGSALESQKPYVYELTTSLTAEQVEFLRGVLDDHQSTLAFLEQATQMPECRFPVDARHGWLNGGVHTAPHLGTLRVAMRLLKGQMNLDLLEGDVDALLKHWQCTASLPNALAMEPDILSHLVRLSLTHHLCAVVEESQTLVSWRQEHWQAMAASLEKINLAPGFERALVGDLIYMHETLDETRRQMSAFRGLAADLSGFLNLNKIALLELGTMDRQASKAPEKLGEYEKQQLNYLDHLSIICTLAKSMHPSSLIFLRAHYVSMSHLHLTRLAVAAHRYRLRQGAWPASVQDLAGDVPAECMTSPFDGKPYRMKVVPDGVMLYGPGKSGIDYGGKEQDARGNRMTEGADVTFTLRLPPTEPQQP